MHIKKTLGIVAVTALLAVPALGATNANTHAHADGTTQVTTHLTHSFDGYPAGTPVYDGHGGNPQPNTERGVLGHSYSNGHQMVIIPNKDLASDAIHNNSNSNKSNSNTTTNDNNSSNNTQSGVQNGKLAQTGESNTGAKAGIVGAIAAMVSVSFAGVEKFFKRA